MSSIHADSLVNKLFDHTGALADGNGVAAADLVFVDGSRADREIVVTQTIAISWDRRSESFPGRRTPSESRVYPSGPNLLN